MNQPRLEAASQPHEQAPAEQQRGRRLDQVLAELFDDYSRSRLQQWIRAGQVALDGRVPKTREIVQGGEQVQIDAEVTVETVSKAQAIALDVVYEDDDMLVINKPPGLVVHPAAGNPDGTLLNALLYHAPDLAALPRAGIVHRLDKETSGVMVVARSLRAHTSLVQQLQRREMGRVYEAVITGDLISGGTVDAPIGRHPRDRKKMAVVAAGKPAVSHYRVLERFGGATHIEVSLETGRTHQIRVHMAHLGHPLVGDPVYGHRARARAGLSERQFDAVRSFARQALHARTLRLVHPGDRRSRVFEAPLPPDLAKLLSCLREETRPG